VEVSLHSAMMGATAAFAVPRLMVADMIAELKAKGSAKNAGCVALPVRGAEGRGLRTGSVIELNCVDMLVVVTVRAVPRRIRDLNASSEVRCVRREFTGKVGWRMFAPISFMLAEDALIGSIPRCGETLATVGVTTMALTRAIFHASPTALPWDACLAMAVRYVTWLWVRGREGRLRRRRSAIPPSDLRHDLNMHLWTLRGDTWFCGTKVGRMGSFSEFTSLMNAVAFTVLRFNEDLELNRAMDWVSALTHVREQVGDLRFDWEQ